jgi:hypothetical protein
MSRGLHTCCLVQPLGGGRKRSTGDFLAYDCCESRQKMSRGLHTCYLVLAPVVGGREAQVTISLMTAVRTEKCAGGCTRAILFSPGEGGKEAHVTTLHLTVVRAERNEQGVAYVLSYSAPGWGEEKKHR